MQARVIGCVELFQSKGEGGNISNEKVLFLDIEIEKSDL